MPQVTGRILVGIDGSKGSAAALSWALDEASRRAADVEALYAWHVPAMAYAGGYIPPEDEDIQETARQLLEDMLGDRAGKAGVPVHLSVARGYPSRLLRQAAEDSGVALSIVGKRGWGEVRGLLLGSVSQSMAHNPPKPLVIVPSSDKKPSSSPVSATDEQRRIVVGVDGSDDSLAALRWGLSERDVRDARVQAVLVWSPPAVALPPVFGRGGRESTKRLEQAAHDMLDRVVDAAGDDDVERTTVKGKGATALVKVARSAELLVVGTRGMGATSELFLGSTSQACAVQASVPVVIVPNR